MVKCTPVMWLKLAQPVPPEYAPALAVMMWNDRDETVSAVLRRLWVCADTVHSPTQARITAVETSLLECIEKMGNKTEETHQKLRAFSKSPQYRPEALLSEMDVPQLGKEDTPHKLSCGFSCVDYGENMKRWDGKPTSAA